MLHDKAHGGERDLFGAAFDGTLPILNDSILEDYEEFAQESDY